MNYTMICIANKIYYKEIHETRYVFYNIMLYFIINMLLKTIDIELF